MKKTKLSLLVLGVVCIASAHAGAVEFPDVNLKVCTGCHGANFERKAMGQSKVVKDMSKADIIAALKGYKSGKSGGKLKVVMQGQVRNMSDRKIDLVASKIAFDSNTIKKEKVKIMGYDILPKLKVGDTLFGYKYPNQQPWPYCKVIDSKTGMLECEVREKVNKK